MTSAGALDLGDKECGLVLKARLLDVMGADGFGRRRAAVGNEPWNIPLLGGRRDEVEPAKKLEGAARRWEETQENVGSWEPDKHQLLKQVRVEHRPLGPATCRSLRTLTRVFFVEGGASLPGEGRGKRGRKEKIKCRQFV